MTTNNNANKNSYPFLTKNQIKTRLAEDRDFAVQCFLILDSRQTEDEHEEKETIYKNRRGWMSSHAVNGTRIAEKLRSGESLNDDELGLVHYYPTRYTRQLASFFRAETVKNTPDLAAQAACFFTGTKP
ncbi:MAG TPA: hypothetical protein VIE65_12485 [Methylobacter sp.]|jgi:anaerobic ribonucleoside-triphosphate reductase